MDSQIQNSASTTEPSFPLTTIEKIRGLTWAAIRTKPRCEKILAAYCARRLIHCYLPLLRRVGRYQRRTVTTAIPMFPGYIFAQISPEIEQVLLNSHKAIHILPTNEIQEECLISELRSIQNFEAIQEQVALVVQPELVTGTQVRIVSGPLAGVTGVVERRQQQIRVTVCVEMLGQSVSAELDLGDVEMVPA